MIDRNKDFERSIRYLDKDIAKLDIKQRELEKSIRILEKEIDDHTYKILNEREEKSYKKSLKLKKEDNEVNPILDTLIKKTFNVK